MRRFILLLSLLITGNVFSQNQDEILAEAWLLYNSEMASWHGTDIFRARFADRSDKVGGYFSYSEGHEHTCIFFSTDDDPDVLASITFTDNFVPEAAMVKDTPRKLTSFEKDLFTIRQKALSESVTDTLFKRYNNTNLNFIPLIVKDKKKVYVLTGPTVTGVVIFGNDYLIEFDKKNNIKKKRALHANIIPIEYTDNPGETTTMHSHVEETGDLITATDICTLLLYSPYTHWEQHYVVSKKNVSIWNCKKDELLVLTREAWDRINEHQREKEKQ